MSKKNVLSTLLASVVLGCSANVFALQCTLIGGNCGGSAYYAEVIITNNTGVAVESWELSLEFNQLPSINTAWLADVEVVGNKAYATNLPFNGRLNPGESTTFGIQGVDLGSFELPICTSVSW